MNETVWDININSNLGFLAISFMSEKDPSVKRFFYDALLTIHECSSNRYGVKRNFFPWICDVCTLTGFVVDYTFSVSYWSKTVSEMASFSTDKQSIAGKKTSAIMHYQTEGQEWTALQLKRVLYGLCWLMHSSRACTLGPMTWEVWLWGHHQNSSTSQHL